MSEEGEDERAHYDLQFTESLFLSRTVYLAKSYLEHAVLKPMGNSVIIVTSLDTQSDDNIKFKDACEMFWSGEASFGILTSDFSNVDKVYLYSELLRNVPWQQLLPVYPEVVGSDLWTCFWFVGLILFRWDKARKRIGPPSFEGNHLDRVMDLIQLNLPHIVKDRVGVIRKTLESFVGKRGYFDAVRQLTNILCEPLTTPISRMIKEMSTATICKMSLYDVSQALSVEHWVSTAEKMITHQEATVPMERVAIDLKNLTSALVTQKKKANAEKQEKGDDYDPREYRSERRAMIEAFMKQLGFVKSFSAETGMIYSQTTLQSVVSYCQNLLSSQSLSDDDQEVVIGCRDQIIEILSDGEQVPLSAIKESMKDRLEGLCKKFNIEGGVTDIKDAILRFLSVSSSKEAWNYAQRLKGTVYEVAFAQTYDLKYIKENLKPSLLAIVFNFFHDKFSDFLKRSSQHPEVRSFVPDFVLIKGTKLSPEWRQAISLTEEAEGKSGSKLDRIDSGMAVNSADLRSLERFQTEEEGASLIVKEAPMHYMDIAATNRLMQKVFQAFDADKGCASASLGQRPGKDQPAIYIIEVGYQTSSSEKVQQDVNKWDRARDILSSIGIKLNALAFSDNTKEMKERSWLKPSLATEVASTIGSLFGKLQASLPIEESNMALGDIAAQKLRSLISSSHMRRSPIVEMDIVNCAKKIIPKIENRVNGTKLPGEIVNKLVKNLVTGSIIRESKAVEIKNHIAMRAESVVNAVTESDNAFEAINKHSYLKFYRGTLDPELESRVNLSCTPIAGNADVLRKSCNEKTSFDLMKQMEVETASYNYHQSVYNTHQNHECKAKEHLSMKRGWASKLLTSLGEKCHLVDVDQASETLSDDIGSERLESLYFDKENTVEQIVSGKLKPSMRFSPRVVKKSKLPDRSILDRLASLTLPGRTGRQKDIKNKLLLFMELCSKSTDGFMRDSKGAILASDSEIKRKTGLQSPQGEERRKRNEQALSRGSSHRFFHQVEPEAKKDLLVKEMLNLSFHFRKNQKYITPEAVRVMEDFRKFMETVKVDSSLKTCSDVIRKDDPKMFLNSANFLSSLANTADRSGEDSDSFTRYFEGLRRKIEQSEKNAEFDSRYKIPSKDKLDEILKDLGGLCEFDSSSNQQIILIPELMSHLRKMYPEGTVGDKTSNAIEKFCKYISKFKIFKVLFLYSKICETFINFISEMTRSAYKVSKVPGTKLNILAKINRNRTTNCSCVITDNNFERIGESFLMKRDKAVLGQSLIYCVAITLFQMLFAYGGLDAVLDADLVLNSEDTKKEVEEQVRFLNKLITCLYEKGDLTALAMVEKYQKRNELLEENSSLTSSSRGVRLAAKYLCNIAVWMLPSLMMNSRGISKMSQMIRYPFMLCISEFGMPYQIGKKFDNTERNVSEWIYKRMIKLTAILNIKNTDQIKENWKRKDNLGALKVTSVQAFPLSCRSERQFLSDIYICHIYNKERDDYSEGSIDVVEELVGKVLDWEVHLAEQVGIYNKIKEDPRLGEAEKVEKLRVPTMRILMLLGCKNIKADDGYTNVLAEADTEKVSTVPLYTIPARRKGKLAEGEDLSSAGSASSANSRGSTKMKFDYAKRMQASSSVVSTTSVGSEFFLKVPGLQTVDDCKADYTMETVLESARQMKKHTYGSPEFVQTLAELSRSRYNHVGISRALKSKKNHEQISKITETTSVLSGFLDEFDVEEAINIINRKNAVKLAKFATRDFRITTANTIKYKNLQLEIERMLLTSDEIQEEMRGKLQADIASLKASSRQSWMDICQKSLDEVVMTDNASHLFTFIKTFWSSIRKLLGKERHELLNMSDAVMTLFSKDIRVDEVRRDIRESLAIVKEQLAIKSAEISEHFTEKFLAVNKLDRAKFIENLDKCVQCLLEISLSTRDLEMNKKEHPSASYPEIESELVGQERTLQREFSKELLFLTLLNLVHQMVTPLTICRDKFNASVLREVRRYLKISEDSMDSSSQIMGERLEKITEGLDKTLSNEFLREVHFCAETTQNLQETLEDNFHISLGSNISLLQNYVQLLLFKVYKPVEYKVLGKNIGMKPNNDLAEVLKQIIANTNHKDADFDFSILVVNLVKGSLLMTRKLLDRREKGIRLPRSPRSKVIYEMIRKAKSLGTTNVHELAFQILPDPSQEFCAGSAGKEQIGAVRDLQILDSSTKICIHSTETFSKSLMESCTRNDGLTNKRLKEEILSAAQSKLTEASDSNRKINIKNNFHFHKVLCISGDCTKWGPIHCPAYFSLVQQQILKEFPDWRSVCMLTMLKSLVKKVEIPEASKRKIIGSALMDRGFKKNMINLPTKHAAEFKKYALVEFVKLRWKNNDIVQKLVEWYLADGKSYVTTYNHMGQGIHHATSSLHGNVCGPEIDNMVTRYLASQFNNAQCNITHAGSSDDFAKIIEISLNTTEELYERLNLSYQAKILKALNYMNGLMRAAQMQVSDKSVAGDIVMEFYSEYMMKDRVSPSTAKFIISQIINNTVTTPITLYQMTHVECQQAMYMGVCLAVVIFLALCKQNIFFSHSYEFYKRYHQVIWDSIPAFGALYVPQHSSLLSQSPLVADLERFRSALHHLKTFAENQKPMFEDLEESVRREDMLSGEPKLPSSAGSATGSEPLMVFPPEQIQRHIFEQGTHGTTESNMEYLPNMSATAILLTLIAFKYYSAKDSVSLEGGFRRSTKWDVQSVIADPFIQLKPESVRGSIMQIKEMQKELGSVREYIENNLDELSACAANILWKNTTTEKTIYELGRIEQALEAKSIIWGLSGGLKELAIPLFRQCLRGYMLENKTPIDFLLTWAAADDSKYISGEGKNVPATQRIRFRDLIDKVGELRIVSVKQKLTSTDTNLLELPTDPDMMPFEIVKVEGSKDRYELQVNMQEMSEFLARLDRFLAETRDATYQELKVKEHMISNDFTPSDSFRMNKMRVQKKDKASLFSNKISVVVANFLSPKSLFEVRPVDIDFPQLQSDVIFLQTGLPSLHGSLCALKVFLSGTDKLNNDASVADQFQKFIQEEEMTKDPNDPNQLSIENVLSLEQIQQDSLLLEEASLDKWSEQSIHTQEAIEIMGEENPELLVIDDPDEEWETKEEIERKIFLSQHRAGPHIAKYLELMPDETQTVNWRSIKYNYDPEVPYSYTESNNEDAMSDTASDQSSLHLEQFYGDANRVAALIRLTPEERKAVIRSQVDALATWCRSLGNTRTPYQDMFMFTRPHADKEVTNCSSLVSNNTFEGYYSDPQPTQFYSLQDQDIHTLKCVITCIGWSDLNDNEKTTMLIRFLTCNLNVLNANTKDEKFHCGFRPHLKSLVESGLDEPVCNIFANQAAKEKKQNRRDLYRILARFSTNISDIIKENISWSLKPHFRSKGDVISGYFTFSCEHGSATCIVRNSTLYLTVSRLSPELLSSMESDAGKFLGLPVASMMGPDLREAFYKALPKARHSTELSGKYIVVSLSARGDYRLMSSSSPRRGEVVGDFRYVFNSDSNLVPIYMTKRDHHSKLKVNWGANSLSFVLVSECHSSIQIPSLVSLKQAMKNVAPEKDYKRFDMMTGSSSREDEIGKLKFPSSINIQAAAVFHFLYKHPDRLFAPSAGLIRPLPKPEKAENTFKPESVASKLARPFMDRRTYTFFIQVLSKVVSKSRGTESIYPIFELLKAHGYSELMLSYDGLKDFSSSQLGGWSLQFREFLPPNTLSSIMLGIVNFSEERVTKESLSLVTSCQYQKEIRDILTPFIKAVAMTNNPSLNDALAYLVCCGVCLGTVKRVDLPMSKSAGFIRKIAESNSVQSLELCPGYRLEIAVEDATTLIKLSVPLVLLEGNYTPAQKLMACMIGGYPVIGNFARDRLFRRPELSGNALVAVLVLPQICYNDKYFLLLEQIGSKVFADAPHKQVLIKILFYRILHLMYGSSYDANSLNLTEQTWVKEAQRSDVDRRLELSEETQKAFAELTNAIDDDETMDSVLDGAEELLNALPSAPTDRGSGEIPSSDEE